MKSTDRKCVRCGAPLARDQAAERPCPRCLLGLGLAAGEPPPEVFATAPGHSTSWPTAAPSIEELALAFPALEILDVLGEGGMGVVYRARQRDLDRMVALKILRPPAIGAGEDDPFFAERFTREARALARLGHPNIVQVFDFGHTDGHYFLLMELVDGTNLRHVMESGELAPAQALDIVSQVSAALHYAHDAGVVHRDVKPENILLDRTGKVRIVDFGLAKVTRAEESALRLTHTGQAMGTPQYMAPEQIERPLEVDHRADIYSLGVVFYELLTGELPLGRFALPSEKVQVDVRLDEVVLRSLQKEPERRYQHVSEVETDLDAVRRHPRHQGSGHSENSGRSDRKRRDRVGKGEAPKRRQTSAWAWALGFVFLITCLPLSCAALFLARSSSPAWVEEAPIVPAPARALTVPEPGDPKPEERPDLLEIQRRIGQDEPTEDDES